MGLLQEIVSLPGSFVRELQMSRTQALIAFTSFWCWTIGSMHFYLLVYSQTVVASALQVQVSDINYANTTSMLSRSVGAFIFGYFGDQFGRKLPMLVCLTLMGVFTLCSGVVQTYPALVGVRFLFGRCFSHSTFHPI